MQLRFLFLSALLILSCTLIAQSVGINTQSPDFSAALHIQSNKKGLLIPTMTATERNEIIWPAPGLLVYQADKISGFFYNSGTADLPDWKKLINENLGLNGITGQTIRYNGDR